MRKGITEIDGNADLLNQVHLNFARRIKLCIENDGNHINNIIYYYLLELKKNLFQKYLLIPYVPRLCGHPV